MVAIDPIIICKGCIALPATKLTIFFCLIICPVARLVVPSWGVLEENQDFPSKQYRQWQKYPHSLYLTKFIYAYAFYLSTKASVQSCHYSTLYSLLSRLPLRYQNQIRISGNRTTIIICTRTFFLFTPRLTKIALQQQMIFRS
jgi:hypothetical protein